ncbi:hypothetical protein BKA66DRAFT_506315 [Pyrenochaeta sp. MPI-SDFR-AT-0127]|nr:hypothetical protein BKA66DRAFT_506315 [Pyrenochaeta sp. MPI-SDFR-AT-0127]
MASDNSDNSPSPFQCSWPECTLSYQRREHLNRHLTKHFKTTRFPCPYCETVLGRRDSLRRHIVRYHEGRELIRTRVLRACTHCKARKTQCSGILPCAFCSERGLSCSYEAMADGTAGDLQNFHGQMYELTSQTTLPSREQEMAEINSCTNSYFRHFHPTWSFLHKATFHPTKESRILVQSVVMVGLWVTKEMRAQTVATEIHERLMASIQLQRAIWDVSNSHAIEETSTWLMGTYQAILLNVIFSLKTSKQDTCGSHQNRLLAESCHEILIALVKSSMRRGMFSYPKMLAQYREMNLDPHTAPHIWVGIEESKRFALTLYHVWKMYYDTQGSSDPGTGTDLLSLQDLHFSAPVSDDIWNAETVPELIRMVEDKKENGNQICDNEMNWICKWSSNDT